MILGELGLIEQMMPCDVSTQWNSTYDMLQFAMDYQNAIIKITAEKEMKLQIYKMDKTKWEIAGQLSKVLKVCFVHAC